MDRKNVNQLGRTKTKGVAVILLAFALIMGSFVVPVTSESGNLTVTVVEAAAKKDKKKPVIKFSGKTNITVEKNEVVKIPKTTAKDNKDGNVTKKISVTVKKGKTSYKSIAKKIKKNKKVKFASVGKYTITYTVKDKAGNKATKKRYVTVVDSKKKDTGDKTTKTTTQATTEEVTTEATTEGKTTETSKIERPSTGIYQETINGVTYNITRDVTIFDSVISAAPFTSDKIHITIENDYEYLYLDESVNSDGTSQYLKYFGSIKATDENGKDISENIIIYQPVAYNLAPDRGIIAIYVQDENGNSVQVRVGIIVREFYVYYYDDLDELELISSNPPVYGIRRSNAGNVSLTN